MEPFFYLVIAAGAIAGGSTGLLGTYIVGMRIPFIGTCISHAALAGMMFGLVVGWPVLLCGLVMAGAVSLCLALVRPERTRMDVNVGLSILFSLMMGLAFLLLGMIKGDRSEAMGLLWGSLLFVDRSSVWILAALAAALVLFVYLFSKELKGLLFSREIAAMTGMHSEAVYAAFLVLCSVILTMDLSMIGGLMIFSLITNPAAAAYQICRGHRAVAVCSVLFGVVSAVSGFLVSFYANLPTGASIVCVSTLIVLAAMVWRKVSGRRD